MNISITDKIGFLWLKTCNSRVGSLLLFSLVLLQRSPIVRWFAEAQFSISNRIIQAMPYTVATIVATSTHHAVSGASGDLIMAQGNTKTINAKVGEPLEWVFQIDQGTSSLNVQSYSFHGSVPSGITVGPLKNGNRVVRNFGVITGVPQEAGQWSFQIRIWREANFSGENRFSEPMLTIVVEPAVAENPIMSFFGPDVTGDTAGWANTSWFGWFYAKDFPYIIHTQHGGLYLAPPGNEGSSMWIYDPQLGYLWTSKDFYSSGYLYSHSKTNWLLYFPDFFSNETRQRWFYDFSINDYINIPQG